MIGLKNTGKIIIISILIAICAGSITYLIVRQNKKSENIPETNIYMSEKIEDECTEEYKEEQEQQDTTAVSSTEEKVAANAILVLKKYYKKCDHTINEYVELPQELVNLTKEQVQEKYADWEVIGFEKGKITLYNVPNIQDVQTMFEIIRDIGGKVTKKNNKMIIDTSKINTYEIPENLMRKMRSSVILAGAIIGKYNKANFSYPGDCDICWIHRTNIR